MIVLGIESSCDDTGAAIVTDKKEILGEALQSQEEHKQYGGVVPEIAARAHLEHVDEMVSLCLHFFRCMQLCIQTICIAIGQQAKKKILRKTIRHVILNSSFLQVMTLQNLNLFLMQNL